MENTNDAKANVAMFKKSHFKRVKSALVPVISCLLLLLFFSPLETVLSNPREMPVNSLHVVLIMGALTVISSAVIIFAAAFLKDRIFNCFTIFCSALLIAVYIQCIFFNSTVTILDISYIVWEDHLVEMIINLFVWALALAAPFVLWYKFKSTRKAIIFYIPLLILIMQTVGLIGVAVTNSGAAASSHNKDNITFFSRKDITAYSGKSNVILILVDTLDYDYIAEIEKTDPGFFNKLDGFTSFTNSTSEFAKTLPGANHLITGAIDGAYIKPIDDYLDEAWTDGGKKSIVEVIDAKDYTVDLYANLSVYMSQDNPVLESIDNVSTEKRHAKIDVLIKRLVKLSLYKCTPVVAKRCFTMYSEDFFKGTYYTKKAKEYTEDDALLCRQFDNDITTVDRPGYFKMYHLQGSHFPYTLNADGSRNRKPTDVISQTKGVFNCIYKLIDKLKKAGIYEKTEIIITADHGYWVDFSKPLSKATCIGMFHKPAGASGTPLAYSNAPVSQLNVPPTILKAVGYENYGDYGKPLTEINENDEITRYMYRCVNGNKKINNSYEAEIIVYEITGDAKDFSNWNQIKTYKVENGFY